MRHVFLLALALSLNAAARVEVSARSFQESPAKPVRRTVDLPPRRIHLRPPELTLAQALRKAEGYIRRRRVPVAGYFLEEAKFVGDGSGRRWHFRWMNVKGVLGDYVLIAVSMDGKVWRTPSM